MIIGMCGYDKVIENKLNGICERVFLKHDMDYQIKSFDEVPGLYDLEYNIMILDIDRLGMNGIKLKEQHQLNMTDTLIIFIANTAELMGEAFGRNVIGFVNKDDLENDLEICLHEAVRILKEKVIICGHDSENIIYMTCEGSDCVIKVKGTDKKYFLRCSLKKMEEMLRGTPLVKVHKSFIVNLKYVDSIDDGVITIGDEKIPVSVRKRKDVENKYRLYCDKNNINKST